MGMAELKRETESLLYAVQEQAPQVNAIKYSFDKINDTPLCRLYNEKTENITQIVRVFSILAKIQYTKRHGKVGTYVHWLLCKKYNAVTSGTQANYNQSREMTNIKPYRISIFKQIKL